MQRKKLLEKILRNPKHVRFEDLDKLFRQFGFERRNPRTGSSHYIYFKSGFPEQLSVPYKRPFLKEIYVKKALELIEKIVLLEEVENNEK